MAAVLLLIASSYVVAGVAFDSLPWLAGIFGLMTLGMAWKLRTSRRVIPLIYTMFGAVFLILGIWITIAKAVS